MLRPKDSTIKGSRTLDTNTDGSGKRARRWLSVHFPNLGPYEHRLAWYLAGLADLEGCAWPAHGTIAGACGMSRRKVISVLERLVADGALVEAGMRWTRRQGAEGARTRCYRIPFAGDPVPVMPSTRRRRLARLAPIDAPPAELESARRALSTKPTDKLESARRALSTRPAAELESARRALSTGPEMGSDRELESARRAVSTASRVHDVHTIPRNPDSRVGAIGSGPSERTIAPRAGVSTATPSPVAARELVDAELERELTPAELEATVDRRQRALRLLRPIRSTAAETEAKARAVAAERQRRNAERQARLKAKFDARRGAGST